MLVTYNSSPKYVIANGTLGIVVGFTWPANTLDEDENVRVNMLTFQGNQGSKFYEHFIPLQIFTLGLSSKRREKLFILLPS